MAAPTKYKLFEVTLNDNVYVRVESDFPSQMFSAHLSTLQLTEYFSAASPSMQLNFVDQFGDLVNNTYLTPEVSYDVYFGKSHNDNSKSSFSLSVNKAESTSPGAIENVAMSVNFLRHEWFKLVSQTHSRSWTDKRYSQAIEDIAKESGFNKTSIETTDGTHNILQPHWTNYQLIKWIADHAISSTGVSGYDLAVTLDNRFLFQTYNKFFDQIPYRDYVLVSPSVDTKFAENQLFTMSMEQQYAPIMSGGGFGSEYSYFDYENKEFVTKKLTVADTNQSQLSDWYFIPKEHSTPSKQIYAGRDIDAIHTAENDLVNRVNAIQSMNVSILGDSKIHIGDVVGVVLPTAREDKKIFNEMYSGYWLVTKVIHLIDFKNSSYITKLALSRAGINSTEIKNLVKSKVGKQIKTKKR